MEEPFTAPRPVLAKGLTEALPQTFASMSPSNLPFPHRRFGVGFGFGIPEQLLAPKRP